MTQTVIDAVFDTKKAILAAVGDLSDLAHHLRAIGMQGLADKLEGVADRLEPFGEQLTDAFTEHQQENLAYSRSMATNMLSLALHGAAPKGGTA